MKKWPMFFAIYFCACLLAACGASGSGALSNEEQSGGEGEAYGGQNAHGLSPPPVVLSEVL